MLSDVDFYKKTPLILPNDASENVRIVYKIQERRSRSKCSVCDVGLCLNEKTTVLMKFLSKDTFLSKCVFLKTSKAFITVIIFVLSIEIVICYLM